MKTLPGTKLVTAAEIQEGDIILKDDGSYYATVEEKYFDPDGIWLNDGHSEGYVDSSTKYLIEWE